MKLSQLEYFVEAAKTLNFTRAAANLYTSRQNVSHAVKELESELDVKLFAQSGGLLVLTIDGQKAVRYAEQILQDVSSFRREFQEVVPADRAYYILVGTNILTFSQYGIPEVLTAIDGIDYNIGELNCSDCYDRILSKDADLAFIACMPREFPGIEATLIDEDYLYLLLNADSDLAQKDGLIANDLIGKTLLAPPGFEFQLSPLVENLAVKGAPKSGVVPISSFDYVMTAVRERGSIGIASAAQKPSIPSEFAIRPLVEPGMRMGLYAMWKQGSPLKRVYRTIASAVSDSLE